MSKFVYMHVSMCVFVCMCVRMHGCHYVCIRLCWTDFFHSQRHTYRTSGNDWGIWTRIVYPFNHKHTKPTAGTTCTRSWYVGLDEKTRTIWQIITVSFNLHSSSTCTPSKLNQSFVSEAVLGFPIIDMQLSFRWHTQTVVMFVFRSRACLSILLAFA